VQFGLRAVPEKPTDRAGNGYIDAFNGRVRDECLSQPFLFTRRSARTPQSVVGRHNWQRLHRSLSHLTPSEFATQGQRKRIPERIPLQP